MKRSNLFITILVILIFGSQISSGQTTTCSTAVPVCLNDTITYPMNTNTIGESGPNYGCLYTYPNPAWYYFKTLNPGNINIQIAGRQGTIARDVDFICWGPFNTLDNVCTDSLYGACTWELGTSHCPNNTVNPAFYPTYSAPNIIDCSYDAAPTETCHIQNAQTGKYYLLCVTNYSSCPGYFSFTQISGTGSSDCSFLGINEDTKVPFNLSVFPNPNNGKFNISFISTSKTSYKIEIFNTLGQTIIEETIPELFGKYTKDINLIDFGSGIYTICLTNSVDKIIKKVVVN